MGKDGRILLRNEGVALVAGCYDELVTKNAYDITADDITLNTSALLKVKSTASGNIKIKTPGGTDIVMDAIDVNSQEVYVTKIYKTGTTIGNTFYLWV